jgi:hypothetical protein
MRPLRHGSEVVDLPKENETIEEIRPKAVQEENRNLTKQVENAQAGGVGAARNGKTHHQGRTSGVNQTLNLPPLSRHARRWLKALTTIRKRTTPPGRFPYGKTLLAHFIVRNGKC